MLRSATFLLAALAGIVAGITRPDPASAGESDFGIVITNSTYLRADVNPVEYAHFDGAAMRKAMQEVFNVPGARIRDYKDTTLSGFYGLFGRERAKDGEIYNLLKGTHPKSRVIVYYAGHGVPRAALDSDEDKSVRAYLLPTDGNPLSPENSGYAVSELIERLKQIKADRLPEGQIILILEACFTGGTDRGTVVKGISAGSVPAKLAPLASSADGDIIIMTASQGNQVASWDDERKMSVFTNTLIDGLYGWADEPRFHGNADKKVTLKELYAYTTSQVSIRLDKLDKKRAQHPSFTGPDTLELAHFDHPLIRDPEQRSSEERTCNRLKSVGSETEITGFLSGCRYCMCQQELNDKLSAMRIGRSACAEDRKLRMSALDTGNLAQLTYLSANTACPGLKDDMAVDVSRLRDTCAVEKLKADAMKVAADLRIMATSARCQEVRSSASERADRMEQACTQSRAQWEDLKERGMPDDLKRFGQRIGCPEIQIQAEALAEERLKLCQIETGRFNEFAFKRNYNGIRMLAERASCPEVKLKATKAVDNLAREQEERCKSDDAKWAAFTDRADPEKLRKVRAEIECERVAAEIDKELEKHKPSLVSGPINDCPTCPKVVGVKPGCFVMGAAASDRIADENERPTTTVRVAAPFAIGVTEVTVAEWSECHKQGACRVPVPAGDAKLPMRGVSYEDAKGYVAWLQRTSGHRFRLPTEAEWEFVARAGHTTPYSFGTKIDQTMARFSFGSSRPNAPVTVGSFKPNEYGVYDMHGNVAELVEDCYEPNLAGRPADSVARTSCSAPGRFVVRGGSWMSFPKWLRVSHRDAIGVREQRSDVGFRVVRDAPELAGTMSAPSSCP